jgi:TolB-like protein/cytochrome c-type biogenesis protein CcmH/NrfG
MPQPLSSSGGVFLSYAREDTEPARRIADALRAFGVDVWFDQSELRGGDTWDAKIKKQIRECALFVPIVSAHTQARGEGYFRREWKLGVERTHDMAAGVPFLVPVVIDETLESEALVPDELMRVQWTRLARGVPTPQFVDQVKRLLEGPAKPAAEPAAPRRSAATGRTDQVPVSRANTMPRWAWVVMAAVVAAAATVVVVSRRPAAPASSPAPAMADAAPAAPKADDKSLAVLPFANMSDDKDNAFFTDGIHEDILTNLAHIHDLRVVSRTSVMQYQDTKKPIRQIAAELGVAYILEGSVRRAGNRVRVTGQLINAATDEHVWAQAYDRDLTDIFAIQAELAQAIADALNAALSPQEKVLIALRPTENVAAYDLFLRARDVRNREGVTVAAEDEQQNLLQDALKLDPSFGQAWGELADIYAFRAFEREDGVDALVAQAKAAIDRAIQIAPEDPEIIGSLGTYYYYAFRDYARAREQYERLAAQRPNDPTVFNSLALIQRRQGHWAESLASERRALALDPANIGFLRNLIATLNSSNRYDEAAAAQQRLVAFLPDNIFEGYQLANISFFARGSMAETDAYFAHLSPEEASSPAGLHARRDWALNRGDLTEVVRLDRLQPYFAASPLRRWEQDVFAARILHLHGDQAAAIARLGNIPADLRRRLAVEPKNGRNWMVLGQAEVVLGHPVEAMRCADRAVELMPESADAIDGVLYAIFHAAIYDDAGEKDQALAQYQRLLRVPGGTNVYALKYGPSSLHGDPRIDALVADPANNAPLF